MTATHQIDISFPPLLKMKEIGGDGTGQKDVLINTQFIEIIDSTRQQVVESQQLTVLPQHARGFMVDPWSSMILVYGDQTTLFGTNDEIEIVFQHTSTDPVRVIVQSVNYISEIEKTQIAINTSDVPAGFTTKLPVFDRLMGFVVTKTVDAFHVSGDYTTHFSRGSLLTHTFNTNVKEYYQVKSASYSGDTNITTVKIETSQAEVNQLVHVKLHTRFSPDEWYNSVVTYQTGVNNVFDVILNGGFRYTINTSTMGVSRSDFVNAYEELIEIMRLPPPMEPVPEPQSDE